jgi:hypothetical protein
MKARFANGSSDHNNHVAEPVVVTMTEDEARSLLSYFDEVAPSQIDMNELAVQLRTIQDGTNDFGIGHNKK